MPTTSTTLAAPDAIEDGRHADLFSLPHLLTLGLVSAHQDVTVWSTRVPESDGLVRLHASPGCTRARRTGVGTAWTRPAGEAAAMLDDARYRLCGCGVGDHAAGTTCSTGPLLTCSSEDTMLLDRLDTTAEDFAGIADPAARAARAAEHLVLPPLHSRLPVLNAYDAARRDQIDAVRRGAFTDPGYQHARNQLLISGSLQWHWARRYGGGGRLTSWLRELTDTLDIKIPADVEYDPDDVAAVAAVAAGATTAQMWVSPSSQVRQAPETPWAWATTIAARTEARSHLALIPVPILFRLAVGSPGFVPVCLDEDYTAQMVRTAQDLASSTEQVPELVKAVKAATT